MGREHAGEVDGAERLLQQVGHDTDQHEQQRSEQHRPGEGGEHSGADAPDPRGGRAPEHERDAAEQSGVEQPRGRIGREAEHDRPGRHGQRGDDAAGDERKQRDARRRGDDRDTEGQTEHEQGAGELQHRIRARHDRSLPRGGRAARAPRNDDGAPPSR